ncbi:alpha/beta family hydrolase [Flavobacterium sp. ZT3R17]|uniref:alpha/beta family hydrolase n=1 Tax=Flavobacterium cryoconiti TaxID=3398736 RepID=UPI003A876621
MNFNKIFLIVGRENLRKDGSLNNSLLEYLEQHQFLIVYEPIGSAIYHAVNFEKRYIWLPDIFKKIYRKICLFKYAALNFKNYYNYYKKNISHLEFRSRILKQLISKMGSDKEIIIISRSSGGLIASLIADELNIKHIICLGYPFKHPEKEIEPHRFIHLKNLRTPFLIIQGKKDEYGGIEIIGNYTLSPNIELFFVDTNHDFKTSDDDWKNVLTKISTTINLP